MASSIPKNVRHIHRHYRPRHFASLAEWKRYATWLRRHAKVSLALLPEPKRTPLRARVFDRVQGAGFTCEKVAFESLPGFLVTGNLYRPGKPKKKMPGILCPHGHWDDGRLHDHDPHGSVPSRCIRLARMGAVVFSWDMVGYNDSCQVSHRAFNGDAHWGLSLMGLQTWHSIRALDFLLTLPGVDAKRIGVVGCSGGGTQTFTLTAVDDRPAAAAPICMISYHMQGGCLCENAPLLRIDATSVDLARLFAPKPMFMGSCTGDWTKHTPTEELPAVREVYALYGAAKRVLHRHVDDTHNFNLELREAVYGFFNRALFGAKSGAPLREGWFEKPVLRDRMVWWGRQTPEAISPAAFRKLWREHITGALKPHLRSAASARKGLGPLLGHTLGVTLTSVEAFRRRKPEGVNVEATGDALVITSRRGAKDLSGKVQFFSAYNRSFVADRVHEILAAVENAGGRHKLIGKGKAGTWCLLAGALTKRVKALDVDCAKFNPASDAAWKKALDVPSIRQVGGFATALALVGKRPLTLRNATPAFRELARKYAR